LFNVDFLLYSYSVIACPLLFFYCATEIFHISLFRLFHPEKIAEVLLMKFHDDIDLAFKPLNEFVSNFMEEEDVENTLGQYMYMFHDDEVHHYKHFGSREYIKVDPQGKSVQGRIENWRKWK
jgi:hypothetical protein